MEIETTLLGNFGGKATMKVPDPRENLTERVPMEVLQRRLARDLRRAERDLRWLNWHINRGRLAHNAKGPEIRKYMRQHSWRRVH